MNSAHSSKSTVFTMNYAFFKWKTIFFQKQQFLQWIMLSFSKTTVFTMNYTLCGWESFWDLFGTGRGQWQSRAEPSRAEPGRAEPSRAEPSRADSSRSVPNRAKPSQAGGDPHVIFFKNSSFYNELCIFIPLIKTSVSTMNSTTFL